MSAVAQVVLGKANVLPRNGDRVDLQRVETIGVGDHGQGVVWDMSHAVVVEDGCPMRFFNSGDSVVAWVMGKRQQVFEVRCDSVLLRSEETALYNLADSTPSLMMLFPLSYGDSVCSPAYYRGKYSGSNALSVAGDYSTVVDGEGTLILPDDTINTVLRVHECLDARLGLSTSSKEMPSNADYGEGLRYVRDVYCWYSSDFRYPLAHVTRQRFYKASDQIKTDEVSYLCPPAIQLYALGDFREPKHKQTSSSSHAKNTETTSDERMFADKTSSVNVKVAESDIEVIITGGGKTAVTICDLHGRVYFSESDKAVYNIDTSSLPHGLYLLNVNDGKSVRTERISIN